MTEKNRKVSYRISRKCEVTDEGAKHYLAPNLTNSRRWAKQEKGRNNHIN